MLCSRACWPPDYIGTTMITKHHNNPTTLMRRNNILPGIILKRLNLKTIKVWQRILVDKSNHLKFNFCLELGSIFNCCRLLWIMQKFVGNIGFIYKILFKTICFMLVQKIFCQNSSSGNCNQCVGSCFNSCNIVMFKMILTFNLNPFCTNNQKVWILALQVFWENKILSGAPTNK